MDYPIYAPHLHESRLTRAVLDSVRKPTRNPTIDVSLGADILNKPTDARPHYNAFERHLPKGSHLNPPAEDLGMERMSGKTAAQDRRNRSNTSKQLVNVTHTSQH